jgi:hypothetical protein
LRRPYLLVISPRLWFYERSGRYGGWFAGVIFRQQDVQHGAERLCSFLWKGLKMPRSDFCEILLLMIPNHPVVHWVKKSFKPHR